MATHPFVALYLWNCHAEPSLCFWASLDADATNGKGHLCVCHLTSNECNEVCRVAGLV